MNSDQITDREKFGRELAAFVAEKATAMQLSPEDVIDGFAVMVSSILVSVGASTKEKDAEMIHFCNAVDYYGDLASTGTVQ